MTINEHLDRIDATSQSVRDYARMMGNGGAFDYALESLTVIRAHISELTSDDGAATPNTGSPAGVSVSPSGNANRESDAKFRTALNEAREVIQALAGCLPPRIYVHGAYGEYWGENPPTDEYEAVEFQTTLDVIDDALALPICPTNPEGETPKGLPEVEGLRAQIAAHIENTANWRRIAEGQANQIAALQSDLAAEKRGHIRTINAAADGLGEQAEQIAALTVELDVAIRDAQFTELVAKGAADQSRERVNALEQELAALKGK